MIGGIDLGGTKIEARLFDAAGERTDELRRLPTPATAFEAMADALAAQIGWLEEVSGDASLPVGIAVPGLVDPLTGEGFASNVPTGGRSVAAALRERRGRAFPTVNDAMAFACSEARGGAGAGARVVVGLVLGTGVGGGLCVDGSVPPRHSGLSVEAGHLGVPGRTLAAHGLPLLPCGCGRLGCVETYVSGTGLSNLSAWKTGERRPAAEVTDEGVLEIWADVAGDCLAAIQITLDPDCIVLGGGLSNMPGIVDRLAAAMRRHRLGRTPLPALRLARHGDASGARGAALLARDALERSP